MTLPNEPQPAERDQTAESSGWTPVPGSAPMVPAAGSPHDSAPFGTPPPLPNAAPSATGARIFGGVLLALGALAVWWGGPALGAFESPTLDVFRFNPLRLMAGFFGPFAVVVGLGALGWGLSRKGQPARPDALTWVSVALMTVLGLGLLVWGLPGIRRPDRHLLARVVRHAQGAHVAHSRGDAGPVRDARGRFRATAARSRRLTRWSGLSRLRMPGSLVRCAGGEIPDQVRDDGGVCPDDGGQLVSARSTGNGGVRRRGSACTPPSRCRPSSRRRPSPW